MAKIKVAVDDTEELSGGCDYGQEIAVV